MKIAKMKKWLVMLAACLVLFGAQALAEGEGTQVELQLLRDGFLPVQQPMQRVVSRGESFEEFMFARIEARETKFSVEKFGFTSNGLREAFTMLLDGHPDLFYVSGVYTQWESSSGVVTEMEISYPYAESEIASKTQAFNASVNEIIRYASMADTTLGKLLLINDWLCVNYEYDDTLEIHSAEEMFRLGTGVCQAYMQCYQAVLNAMDIPCLPVTSQSMVHGWNLVQVDGSWYHVDVTWNDNGLKLGARHEYFLLSDTGMLNAEHYDWSCSAAGSSTTYDNQFWHGIDTPIPTVGRMMYYVDPDTAAHERSIKMWDITNNVVMDVLTYDIAASDGVSGYAGGFLPLAADPSFLYYATMDRVYAIPMQGGDTQLVHTENDGYIWSAWNDGTDVQLFVADMDSFPGGGKIVTFEAPAGPEDTETQTITPVPVNRLVADALPYGLVGQTAVKDGEFSAVLDDAATDWDKVYTFLEPSWVYEPETGGNIPSYSLDLGAEILPPSGAVSFRSGMHDPDADDAAILAAFADANIRPVENWRAGTWWEVAEFDDAASQFITKNADSLYSIQWLDENGEVLLTEKLLYRFTFANSWTTYDCARIKVDSDSITPHAGVDCTVADGSVTYRFAQDEAVVNLVTRFAAPESAVKYTLSELNVNGHIPRFDVADGFASYTLPPAVGVNRTLLLTWYDANSDILGGGVVTISSEGGLPSHTISLVPLSRMFPDDPPHGMVVKNQSTDGAYHIVIDDEQTDWDKVYTLSSPITWTDPDGNVTVVQEVMLGASVLELDEAASFRSVTYYDDLPQDDAALLEDLLQSEISALDYVPGWYWTVAAYDEATGAYTPYEMESSSGGSYLLAVQWLDEDGNVLLTEKMTYHIEHTQPGNTYPAALAPLAKDGIQPNIAGAAGVTCTLNDGSVAYAVSSDATVSILSTAFTAPAGAKYYSFSEESFDPWNDMMIISDGKAVHQLDLTSASEKTLIVAWYDEDWNLLDGGAVTISWEEGQAVQPASPFTFADNGDGTATVTGYTGTDTDAEVPAVYNGLTVTGIGSGAFAGSTLKRLILPDTIVNLADDAFSNYYRNIICSVGSPTATAVTEAGRVFLAREDERLKLRQPLDEEGSAYLHLMVYYDTESSTITIPAEVNGVPITHIGPAFITTNCRQLELPGDDLQFLHPDAFDLYSQGHPTIFCNAGSLTAQTVSDFGSAFRSLDGEMLILMQHVNEAGDYELELVWYADPTAATATVPATVNGVPITRLDEGVVTENCTTLVLPDTIHTIHADVFSSFTDGVAPLIYCKAGTTTAQTVSEAGYGFRSASNPKYYLFQRTDADGNFCLEMGWASSDGSNVLEIPEAIDGVPFTRLGSGSVIKEFTSIVLHDNIDFLHADVFSSFTDGVAPLIYCKAGTTTAQTVSEAGYGFRSASNPKYYLFQRTDADGNFCLEMGWASSDGSNVLEIPEAIDGVPLTRLGSGSVIKEFTSIVLHDNIDFLHADVFSSFTDGSIPKICCKAGTTTAQTVSEAGYAFSHTDSLGAEYLLRQYVDENGEAYLEMTWAETGSATLVVPSAIDGVPLTHLAQGSIKAIYTQVTLPASLTFIAEGAFLYNTEVTATVNYGSYAHQWCLDHNVKTNVIGAPAPASPFTYELDADGTLDITGYTGTDTALVIPAEIDGYPVAEIAAYAFEGLTITSVSLPEGLVEIGEGAFAYCEQLTSLHLPASLTKLKPVSFVYSGIQNFTVAAENIRFSAIDGVLYNQPGSRLLYYPAARTDESFTVPQDVTSLDTNAFFGCQSLKSVVVSEGVVTLPTSAFHWCPQLTSVTLPLSLQNIGENPFIDCGNLLVTVNHNSPAFQWCIENQVPVNAVGAPFTYTNNGDGTATITGYTGTDDNMLIPDVIDGLKVTAIAQNAFLQYKGLTISIPASVESISEYAFSYCDALTAFTVADDNANYSSNDGVLFSKDGTVLRHFPAAKSASYTVPEGTVAIADRAFFSNKTLETVTLPSSLRTIGERSFQMAAKLKQITFNTGLLSIGQYCFNGCYKLEAAHLPETLTTVDTMAFGSTGIISLTIPGSITTMGEDAFSYNSSLTSVTLDKDLKVFDDRLFYSCGNFVATVTYGSDAFHWCLEHYVKVRVEGLYSGPYTYRDNGDGTATILWYSGTDAALAIPAQLDGLKVVEIAANAFFRHSELTSVTLPEGLEIIGTAAFEETSLTTLHLPASLKELDMPAASNYADLESITVEAGSTAYASVDGVLYSKDLTKLVCYPACRTATAYTVPEGVVTIGRFAFASNHWLEKITLPETVTTVNFAAFGYMNELAEINLPKAIGFINNAFTGTSSVTATVTTGSYAHDWCVDNYVNVDIIEGYSVTEVPTARYMVDSIPYGLIGSFGCADGAIRAYFEDDHELTDWNKVYTFNQPSLIHNDQGVPVPDYNLQFGARIFEPADAVYFRTAMVSEGTSDADILSCLETAQTRTVEGWRIGTWWNIASFDEALMQYTPHNQECLYAVQWLDADQNVLLTEKLLYSLNFTNGNQSYPVSPMALDSESITANATNASYAESTVADGSVIYTFDTLNPEIVTEIAAPEGAALYGLCTDYFVPYGQMGWIENGKIDFRLTDWSEGETQRTVKRLVCWYDSSNHLLGGGWITIQYNYEAEAEPEPVIAPIPAARINVQPLACGVVYEDKTVDGAMIVEINDEATDWDKVSTFAPVLYFRDPATGVVTPQNSRLFADVRIIPPEGAVSYKEIAGILTRSDEELRQTLSEQTSTTSTAYISYGQQYAVYNELEEGLGLYSLYEETGENGVPFTYCFLWLDENGEEMFAEKFTYTLTHSNPYNQQVASYFKIAKDTITANVSGASYVESKVKDGHVAYTFTTVDPSILTEIDAPADAVYYNLNQYGYDPNLSKLRIQDGKVGFSLSGWGEDETQRTAKHLVSWYDQNRNLIGGGWITFQYTCEAVQELPGLVLPKALKEIRDEAFMGGAFASAVIPDGCTSIGARAFKGCTNLTVIHIPASVTEIAEDAFEGCSNLTIYGVEGSEAQDFAEAKGLGWKLEK